MEVERAEAARVVARAAARVEVAWAVMKVAAAGMARAWQDLAATRPAPVVLIGSAPTALELLLELVAAGAPEPSLVIGMPVGFVGVAESKRRLAASGLDQIRLEGSRGGAGLVGAAVNALLRAAAESVVPPAN